jgi:hypothetical protein
MRELPVLSLTAAEEVANRSALSFTCLQRFSIGRTSLNLGFWWALSRLDVEKPASWRGSGILRVDAVEDFDRGFEYATTEGGLDEFFNNPISMSLSRSSILTALLSDGSHRCRVVFESLPNISCDAKVNSNHCPDSHWDQMLNVGPEVYVLC